MLFIQQDMMLHVLKVRFWQIPQCLTGSEQFIEVLFVAVLFHLCYRAIGFPDKKHTVHIAGPGDELTFQGRGFTGKRIVKDFEGLIEIRVKDRMRSMDFQTITAAMISLKESLMNQS